MEDSVKGLIKNRIKKLQEEVERRGEKFKDEPNVEIRQFIEEENQDLLE